MAYAHSANAAGRRHALEDHLYAVAETCARYAAPLDAVAPAYWLGLWHDLGKFSPAWQECRLAAEEGRRRRGPVHKAAGASPSPPGTSAPWRSPRGATMAASARGRRCTDGSPRPADGTP